MDHAPRFLALVDRARQRVEETDAPTVRDRLAHAAGEAAGVTLIDVREPEEYAAGRIPGARSMPRGVLERDIEAAVPDLDAPLVLYCGGGYRSALAAASLGEMGYTRVQSMDGGWRAWTDAAFPTESPDAA